MEGTCLFSIYLDSAKEIMRDKKKKTVSSFHWSRYRLFERARLAARARQKKKPRSRISCFSSLVLRLTATIVSDFPAGNSWWRVAFFSDDTRNAFRQESLQPRIVRNHERTSITSISHARSRLRPMRFGAIRRTQLSSLQEQCEDMGITRRSSLDDAGKFIDRTGFFRVFSRSIKMRARAWGTLCNTGKRSLIAPLLYIPLLTFAIACFRIRDIDLRYPRHVCLLFVITISVSLILINNILRCWKLSAKVPSCFVNCVALALSVRVFKLTYRLFVFEQ